MSKHLILKPYQKDMTDSFASVMSIVCSGAYLDNESESRDIRTLATLLAAGNFMVIYSAHLFYRGESWGQRIPDLYKAQSRLWQRQG
jgi:hypothetical protein